MSVGYVVLPWRLASLCVDNNFSFWQELVGHLHGTLQVAADVVAQVDDKIAEILLRQLGQCYEQLGVRLLAEVLYPYISRIIIKHVY